MYRFSIDGAGYRHIHFIGIGGISMSGLAEIAKTAGYHVTGSDSKPGAVTKRLNEMGIEVFNEHKAINIKGADLVVYTDAISMGNEELKAAISSKVDLVDRATFLGALMENYDASIAVSGTHGKTSTTSMLTEIIHQTKPTPTVLLGGVLDNIHGNVLLGERNLLLTEACEYKANILKYRPTMAVLLNVDEDHLDFFDNIEHIAKTFRDYVVGLREDATLIINIDDPYLKKISDEKLRKEITIGITNDSDFQAKNIIHNPKGVSFKLFVYGEEIGDVNLQVMGEHNVINALAAIAASWEYGLEPSEVISGIERYSGVHRRLEFKAMVDGVSVVDDYAHHPTEIEASLRALKPAVEGKLYCIFQPHTFTRTKILLNRFSTSFTDADSVIITDIYAAREKDYGDIHSLTLVEAISKNHPSVVYRAGFDEIVEYLAPIVKPGDMVLTMGAGDVYEIGERLIGKLQS
ncbi:MAG: UDP-N-acetylmuramate--L-alanine ligase [Tissierellia bacterium]|nr:UDP-N-acetylmuramate--L-alanine ligase [Tissierellia bacterium]